jgi:hypothetical protein
MKGGLLIKPKYTEESAFNYFISNSKISVFDSGSSGIIFKCVINNVNNSPYKMIRTGYYSNNVSTILIKLCLIKNDNKDYYNFKFNLKNENLNDFDTDIKNVATEKEFIKEVEVQRDIYNKTKEFNNPICPCIIYSNHLKTKSKDDIELLKNIINRLNSYNKMIINKNVLNVYENDEKITIGLIGMEIAEGYQPLCIVLDEIDYKMKNPKNDLLNLSHLKQKYECMAKLKYIEMAVKTGYSHNDFHDCNFLINKKDKVLFDIRGNIMILDFGDALKIDKNIMEKINNLYKNNNFTEILNELYRIDDVRNFPQMNLSQYNWLIKLEKYTNDIIKILNEQQIKNEELFKKNAVGRGGSNKTNKNKTNKNKTNNKKYTRRNKTIKKRD